MCYLSPSSSICRGKVHSFGFNHKLVSYSCLATLLWMVLVTSNRAQVKWMDSLGPSLSSLYNYRYLLHMTIGGAIELGSIIKYHRFLDSKYSENVKREVYKIISWFIFKDRVGLSPASPFKQTENGQSKAFRYSNSSGKLHHMPSPNLEWVVK